jgi:hypothetical protein
MHTAASHAADVGLELDLTTGHHVRVRALPDGGYEITTTGNDPYLYTKPLAVAYDPDTQFVFALDYFCAKGLSDIQVFFGNPAAAKVSAQGPEVLSSEGWSSYAINLRTAQEGRSWKADYKQFRIDFGRHAGRTIQLRAIQLRQPTAQELQLERTAATRRLTAAAFDARLQAAVNKTYEAKITRIVATAEKLTLTLDLPNATDIFTLCEVPLYQSAIDRREFVWHRRLKAQQGKQTVEIDRIRDAHDRVFSSFVITRDTSAGLVLASHPRFVDHIPAEWELTRDKPKSKKGLNGLDPDRPFMLDDYKALGIHNATKNILLPTLVRAQPGDETFAHTFNGITVHIHRKRLAALDRSMQAMEELGVVVSAIILIPRNTPMSHPDAAPQGIYAMANVVQREGWNVYAAALDFLARPYTRPDRKFGRITHWILHNEVDAGWVWTNAGEKPMATYLDLHYRSMRTAQAVIRRYGNAGSVLISLTHYWTARHNSKCYPPRDMIDLLAKRSNQEGNFDWGLAYHPYPENLRDPKTWLDKKAQFNFQTPLITPKNLEVLDAYMHQPRLLYGGRVRTVVLSEQSANSPGHDEQSYRDQAAAIAYIWAKFEHLQSIESFVMHRWMDHPREGGLNLGIRTHGTTADSARKKPAWDIYRKLGTPEQDQALEWAKSVIGAEHFADIPANVQR